MTKGSIALDCVRGHLCWRGSAVSPAWSQQHITMLATRVSGRFCLAMISRRLFLPALAVTLTASVAFPVAAQVTAVRSGSEKFDRDSTRLKETAVDATALASAAHTAQLQFEQFRRANLPESKSSRGGNSCDEQIGRFCYWYDEKEPPPPREPDRVRDARTRLISLLDSAAGAAPANLWVASQRVRYLAEAGRSKDAIAAALACKATTEAWQCGTLVGFAYHQAGAYVQADSASSSLLVGDPPSAEVDEHAMKSKSPVRARKAARIP